MTLLEVRGLGRSFGGVRAVDDLSFDVPEGAIHSIIGPNGAGKTTLFNLITGVYRPSQGTVRLSGEDVTGLTPNLLAAKGVSRTFQNLQIFGRMTAVENVLVGRHLLENRNVLAHLFRLPGVAARDRASRAKAMDWLDFVGLTDQADTPAAALPYGASKRLEIARALASEARLLMLDEPAAGCNAVETEAIDALIQEAAKGGVTVVLVEHDMKLVMGISDHILVLDQGRLLAEGTAAEVAANPAVITAYLGQGAVDAAPS